MTHQPRFVIAFFASSEAADDAARRLAVWMRSNPAASLRALAVLSKEEDGTVTRLKLGPRQSRRGAGIGIVVGAVAAVAGGGLSLLQGAVIGAAGGGALGSFFHKSLGVGEMDVALIALQLEPGHAAVGARVPERQAEAVAAQLVGYGGSLDASEATRGTVAMPS